MYEDLLEEDEEPMLSVNCLSSFVDLQTLCEKQSVTFSADTNRFVLHSTLKKMGPYRAQKLVKKCMYAEAS